ncbi:MAG TPA: hypothetical protein PLH48_01470 [Acinetobacter johnsonii]|nr:hypothetical protein [Acinetobacter johnsonii]
MLSFVKKAHAEGVYHTAVSQYPNELIIILCGVMMVLGCLASAVTPDPDGVPPTKPIAKIVYSVFGSITALVYIVFYEKELSLVHAAWVGGVSFVAPAVVPSLKALVFDLLPVAMRSLRTFITKWMGADGGKGHE